MLAREAVAKEARRPRGSVEQKEAGEVGSALRADLGGLGRDAMTSHPSGSRADAMVITSLPASGVGGLRLAVGKNQRQKKLGLGFSGERGPSLQADVDSPSDAFCPGGQKINDAGCFLA